VRRPADFSRWLHRYSKWDPKAQEQQQKQQKQQKQQQQQFFANLFVHT